MYDHPPEPDWRYFRELRETVLERFCRRVLDEACRFTDAPAESDHERYLQLYRWLHERDEQMQLAFDDPRRSAMIQQLAALWQLDLIEEYEFNQFSDVTRDRVKRLVEIMAD